MGKEKFRLVHEKPERIPSYFLNLNAGTKRDILEFTLFVGVFVSFSFRAIRMFFIRTSFT